MFKRAERLRELFLVEITRALQEAKDPGLSGFLTVTDLRLSGDAKTVRVYYSLLGNKDDREFTKRALERSVGFIRRRLYAKLRLKFTPRILFIFDDTPEYAHRIENLLSRIRAEDDASLPVPPENDGHLDEIGSASSPKDRRARRPREVRRRRGAGSRSRRPVRSRKAGPSTRRKR